MDSSAPTSTATRPPTARLSKTAADYRRLAIRTVTPDEPVDVWTWCRANLRTYHGHKWDSERAELMRFWYRVAGARLTRRPDPGLANAHLAEAITLALCSQIAKSTWLYALLLYAIANTPRRIGFYGDSLKTLTTAREYRVQRMVELMPQLERQLPRSQEAREHALGRNTWTIGSSLVWWLNASTASDLSMHDLPLMFGDEIERWPDDVGGEQGTDKGEGDPITLAKKRQRTYARTRLFAAASSPGLIHGHTWRNVCAGSHHRPIVLCPACGGADWLNWHQVTLTGDRKLAEVHPDEILREHLGRWACRHCGLLHDAAAVTAMRRDCARHDRWIPGTWAIDAHHPTGHWTIAADCDEHGRLRDVPPYTGTNWSGQAGALYSTDETVTSIAAQLAIAEQGKQSQKKTITNTELGEPWIHVVTSDDQDTATLLAGAQDPQAYVSGCLPPACTARWLVLGFDQQGNRRDEWWFPWVLRAVAPGGDSWLIAAGKAKSEAERDALSHQLWNIGGQARRPDIELMDIANGHFTFDGYLWASLATHRRICFRGDSRMPGGTPWMEVVDEPKRRKTPRPAGVREFKIAPHHWRTRLWDRMRRRAGEPRWALPSNPEAFYLRSLTSEEQVVERIRVAGSGWQDAIVWRPRLVQSTNAESSFRTDNHWFVIEVAIAAAINFLNLDKKLTPVARPGRGPIRIGS